MDKWSFIPTAAMLMQLTACNITPETNYSDYQAHSYNNQLPYYAQSYESVNYSGDYNVYAPQPTHEVAVPETFYVGSNRAPVLHKNQDHVWVTSQNPQGYTIEIANDAKASQVANKLVKTPKTDRTAEVKYNYNGQTYYKGVFGSYSSQQEAEKAFNALPPEIKQGAGIKNWSTIQNNIQE